VPERSARQRRRAGATRQSVRPDIERTALRTKGWLELGGRFVMGDGGVRLLLGIVQHGSLVKAAHAIGWSYRHAWGYLRRAEEVLGTSLAAPRSGKGPARGWT
jgi:molybdate transport system regulatory protein